MDNFFGRLIGRVGSKTDYIGKEKSYVMISAASTQLGRPYLTAEMFWNESKNEILNLFFLDTGLAFSIVPIDLGHKEIVVVVDHICTYQDIEDDVMEQVANQSRRFEVLEDVEDEENGELDHKEEDCVHEVEHTRCKGSLRANCRADEDEDKLQHDEVAVVQSHVAVQKVQSQASRERQEEEVDEVDDLAVP